MTRSRSQSPAELVEPWRTPGPSAGPRPSQKHTNAALDVLTSQPLAKRIRCRFGALGVLLTKPIVHLGFLRRQIGKFRSRTSYEIAFTLFLLLWLHDWPPRSVSRRRYKELVVWYLLNVPRDEAAAGFEAAHLLSSGWANDHGIELLKEIARSARYDAGRAAALNGLEVAAQNRRVPGPLRHQARSALQELRRATRV